jgi:LemA protein
MIIYLIIGLLVVIGFYLVSTYNFFVTSKTRVGAAIQEIGNQLKRQSELIPNLEASAKGSFSRKRNF